MKEYSYTPSLSISFAAITDKYQNEQLHVPVAEDKMFGDHF